MARAACSSVVTALALLPSSKSLVCRNQFLFSGKSKFVGVLTLEKRRCFSSKVSMSLKAGIVGLPNVGKSTLVNAVIGKRIERLKKGKAKDSQSKVKEEAEKSALERIQEALLDGKPARSVPLTDLEKEVVKHLCLLTMKPMIYVANVAETDLAEPEKNSYVEEVKGLSTDLQSGHVVVSAQVESELTELPLEERTEYLNSLGVSESGLGNLIRATYSLLGLQTYFTSGEKETRAWTIHAGMTAPQAAGVIHSDFEKGFIRAETVAYEDFVTAGSLAVAREKGVLRSEGKEYIVKEGDVMLFRFNV